MDFADSPEEAEFRERLHAWLKHNNPGLPSSSTSDAYWDGQASWHKGLYDAGFFGVSWPSEIGGRELSSVYEVIVDEELAKAAAPPRPSLGYLVQGIMRHGSDEIRRRFLPGIVSGRERWCQGFSEPEAGSDLASLTTRAVPDGDDYVITGHKVWTSYSDEADWCLVLARTDPSAEKHRGLSAFAVSMHQPAIEQRPLRMINGITREFGEVLITGARVPRTDMIGEPGEGWRLAMTVVSHEREPGELGYVARYSKVANELLDRVRRRPESFDTGQLNDLAWAIVEADMLQRHVSRRLSERLDGDVEGAAGSIDKLLMTSVEQSVGHAALSIGGADHDGADDTLLSVYLYSRAQSVMGGTSQIPAEPRCSSTPRIACLMTTYDVPEEIEVDSDGPIRIIRLNRPDQLNATNHALHKGLAGLFPQIDNDTDARVAVITGAGRAFSAGGDFNYLGRARKGPGTAQGITRPRAATGHGHGAGAAYQSSQP